MVLLTSATGEGCEYEKSVDVIDGGGGSTKSSPGPAVVDDGVIELDSSGKGSPYPAVVDDGEIELDRSGNSSPDTAAIDGISSDAALLRKLEAMPLWAEWEVPRALLEVPRAQLEAALLWVKQVAALLWVEQEAALLRAELEFPRALLEVPRAQLEAALLRAELEFPRALLEVPRAQLEAALLRVEQEAALLRAEWEFPRALLVVPRAQLEAALLWVDREAALEQEAALLRAEWDALRRPERDNALRRAVQKAGLRRAEQEAALHRAVREDALHMAEWKDALRRLFSSVRRSAFSSAHLDTRLPTGSHSAFNGRAFMEVETGNWETGRLITGVRFGRGLAELTPTSHDFRLEILDDDVPETQAASTPPINLAIILLFVASELSATAFMIKYDETQLVAYFALSTVCLITSMYTARLLARLEGGTERFNVYLRGCSFVFLGLLRLLGVRQGSLVTALKIFLGMSQVVLYWWTAGILETYMNAFGMRRT